MVGTVGRPVRRVPSVDRIESIGGIDRETAIKIRRLLDGRDDPMDYEAGRKLDRACFHAPDKIYSLMTVVDDLLGTYGIECIRATEEWDRFHGDVVAEYCNNGQSYDATILYDTERMVFYVTSWADWMETAERNRRYKLR
jgi:hypothetical protein